jgi:preprotein translocase subunit SecB
VILTATVTPTTARPEKVDVVAVGRFAVVGDTPPPLAVPRFVLHGAPMLLFPYIREIVSNLTGKGLLGPLFMDPMNLPAIMASVSLADSSAAKQIREHPEIADPFGDRDTLLGLRPIGAA